MYGRVRTAAPEVMARLTRRDGVRFPVLVPNARGLEAAFGAGAADIAIFASATETFAQRNLGRGYDAQWEMFAPVVERRTGDEKDVEIPKACPACGTPLERAPGEVAALIRDFVGSL